MKTYCYWSRIIIRLFFLFGAIALNNAIAQTTVTYTQQIAEYDLSSNGSGGIYNNTGTEVGMWMDGDNSSNSFAGNVLWKTFRTGSSTASSARGLKVGDEFTITVSTRGAYYGTIGVSFNSGSLPSANWANRIANSRVSIRQDGINFGNAGGRGSWYYTNGTTAQSFSITPNSVRADYTIKFKLTSANTCNLTVNSTTFYDVQLGGTNAAEITHFSIFMSDDRSLAWDDAGGGRGDVFWKQVTQVQNTGVLDFGLSNTSFTVTDALTNGLNANSTSLNSLNNILRKEGTGNLTLSGANVFQGNTEIIGGYIYLGANSSGTVGNITSGPLGLGTVVLNGGSLASSGSDARTILNPISMQGNFTLGHATNNGALTFSANGTLTGNRQITVLSPATFSGQITGAFAITKLGSGTLTLTNASNSYSGGTTISAGTISVSDAGQLGSTTGAITLGSGSTTATLDITSSLSRTTVNVTDGSTAGVINVASGQTFTITNLNTATGTSNLTKIGKSGAGTLTLSGAGSYTGQLQIGNGEVIVSNNTGLGTNNTTSNRGVDLGLNVGDISQASNVSLLASNNVTVQQSIYVAPNTSGATRTIGVNGSSSTATFSNEMYLDGTLTADAGTGNTLNLSGNLVFNGGLTVTSGTVVLTGVNTYTGITTINGGVLRLNRTGGTTIPSGNDVTINSGGTLRISTNQTLDELTINAGGTLIVDANVTLTISTGYSGSGTIENNGTIVIIGPSTFPGATTTVNAMNNLTINRATGVTLNRSITITGTLTLTSGTFTVGGNTLTINGTISRTSGSIGASNNSATVIFSGSTALTIENSTFSGNINNLTINNSAGVTLNQAITIGSNITLSSGALTGTISYVTGATLVYGGSGARSTSDVEWPASGPTNVTIASGQVTLHAGRTLTGVLTLTGSFDATNNLVLGNTGSLIFNGGSISNFTLPSELQNYTMPSGTSSLSNNLTVSGTLSIGAGILNIGSNTLTVNGAVSRTSGFIGSNGGSINIGGSTGNISLFFDQTTSGSTNRLVNLTVNRASSTITLENEVQVTGTVTPTAGTLNSNGNLVLISTASGTGRIAQIQAGAAISGNVNVQRYVQGGTGRRGWRTMASPINSFSFNQLQEDILITGPGGNTNGFDAATTTSSILTYQESTSGGRGWKNITHINNGQSQGSGMLVFYRGSRSQTNSLTNAAIVPNDTVMDYFGNINQGAVAVNLSYTSTGSASNDGWNLLGNPYPCEINYAALSISGSVSNSYWVWDASTGMYVNRTSSQHIAIGQGFFAQAASSGASVTFNESSKVSTNPTAYFKTEENPLSIKMYQDSTKYDIAWLHFKPNASLSYVFNEDAMKLLNSNINMGFVTSDHQLVQRNVVQALNNIVADTFVISTNAINNGNYILQLDLGNTVPANKDVYLIDMFNNNITNARLNSTYTFQIQNANPATRGNRFRLVIGNAQALPVKLISFSAKRIESGNLISWTTAQEKNMKGYEVQYSADGTMFETIGYVQSKNRATQTQYVFDDNRLVEGYYRLNKVEFNQSEYSHVVRIDNEDQVHTLTIYPNPAKGVVHIDGLQEEHQGTVTIRHTDGKVKCVLTAQKTIDISALEPGLYFVEINTANGSLQKKLLVE